MRNERDSRRRREEKGRSNGIEGRQVLPSPDKQGGTERGKKKKGNRIRLVRQGHFAQTGQKRQTEGKRPLLFSNPSNEEREDCARRGEACVPSSSFTDTEGRLKKRKNVEKLLPALSATRKTQSGARGSSRQSKRSRKNKEWEGVDLLKKTLLTKLDRKGKGRSTSRGPSGSEDSKYHEKKNPAVGTADSMEGEVRVSLK